MIYGRCTCSGDGGGKALVCLEWVAPRGTGLEGGILLLVVVFLVFFSYRCNWVLLDEVSLSRSLYFSR